MKKLILMGIAASVVIGGAMMPAHAQRIPGKGLQQAAYMKASQMNQLVGCTTGGCATQPMSFGGCATEPHVGCGAPGPIPCCPLSGLKNIPRIIPSVQIPDCGSPIVAPCVGGACKIAESIGRAFAKCDVQPECKPDCAVPAPATRAPGACRIMSPGIASLGNGRDCNNCDSCESGARCDDCKTCRCKDCRCKDGRCENGRCEDGRCESGLCKDGRCDDGSSICSRLGNACGNGLCGNGLCGAGGCCGQFGFPDRGWNMPVKTPVTRNPVSYTRYHPTQWYGSRGSGYGSGFPMIYRPTDTTQLGFIGHNVPYWKRGRGPGMPPPASIHNRNCPTGGYSTYGQGYQHRSHHSYPWFSHHMTNSNRAGASAANIAARRPVRRPMLVPRTAAKRPVMQAGFRRTAK